MKVLYIAFLYLRKLFANKKAAIIYILYPILFLILLLTVNKGASTTSCQNIGYINNDTGIYGNIIVNHVKNMEGVNLKKVNKSEVKTLLNFSEENFVIEIPESFSNNIKSKHKPKINILKIGTSNSEFSLENDLNSFVNRLITNNKTIKINSNEVSKNNVKISGTTEFTLRFSVMILMFFMVVVGGEIIDEKKEGTFERVMSASNGKIRTALGFLLSFLIIGVMQCLAIVFGSKFIYKVYWGNSFLSLIMLFICFEFMIISISLLLSYLIKDGRNVLIIAVAIITPAMMLSGSFVPIEAFDESVRKIAYLMPSTWMVSGLKEVVINGGGAASILINCMVILLYAVVFFMIGSRTFIISSEK